jgi:Helix-turn-helix domain
MDDDRNVSLKEGAKQFVGVSPYTLRRWSVYERRIPYIKLGRRILFRVGDLRAFVKAGRIEAK